MAKKPQQIRFFSTSGTYAGLFLSQLRYASEILEKAGLSHCKSVSTPVATSRKLCANAGSPCDDPTLYRSLAGALQYLTFTRPNISYAVQQVCLYMHIEIGIHFVREQVKRGDVWVLHVPSRYWIADIFTKGLPQVLFDDFRSSLCVCQPPDSTAGVCWRIIPFE